MLMQNFGGTKKEYYGEFESGIFGLSVDCRPVPGQMIRIWPI